MENEKWRKNSELKWRKTKEKGVQRNAKIKIDTCLSIFVTTDLSPKLLHVLRHPGKKLRNVWWIKTPKRRDEVSIFVSMFHVPFASKSLFLTFIVCCIFFFRFICAFSFFAIVLNIDFVFNIFMRLLVVEIFFFFET